MKKRMKLIGSLVAGVSFEQAWSSVLPPAEGVRSGVGSGSGVRPGGLG